MILILCTVLLLSSFVMHLLWWRLHVPKHSTQVLLVIFTLLPIVFWSSTISTMNIWSTFTNYDYLRLILLYMSCSLVYISLYSALEHQSPTLTIIDYIRQQGDEGCSDDGLENFLKPDGEIQRRFLAMDQVGWIKKDDKKWSLTKKGRQIAKLFNLGATILGLPLGG